ncbi:MAG TPA: helix-turn-helix domain-containing protein [Kiritimatiellia bacterium]|nr:helix-turn-helix domain-containing protein [Kiritimatiellia bacterium]
MDKEKLIMRVLAATPGELEKVGAVFNGEAKTQATLPDRRLLSIQQAAEALGVSRTTVWRLVRSGQLPTVELRPGGSKRVPSQAVTDFATKGATA